jgi:hypothetical protein
MAWSCWLEALAYSSVERRAGTTGLAPRAGVRRVICGAVRGMRPASRPCVLITSSFEVARYQPARRHQPLARHAQIGHFCAVRLVISVKPVPIPNGGYLRGHTKSRVTLRDEWSP